MCRLNAAVHTSQTSSRQRSYFKPDRRPATWMETAQSFNRRIGPDLIWRTTHSLSVESERAWRRQPRKRFDKFISHKTNKANPTNECLACVTASLLLIFTAGPSRFAISSQGEKKKPGKKKKNNSDHQSAEGKTHDVTLNWKPERNGSLSSSNAPNESSNRPSINVASKENTCSLATCVPLDPVSSELIFAVEFEIKWTDTITTQAGALV